MLKYPNRNKDNSTIFQNLKRLQNRLPLIYRENFSLRQHFFLRFPKEKFFPIWKFSISGKKTLKTRVSQRILYEVFSLNSAKILLFP